MPVRICPKCGSSMQPGYPVEVRGPSGLYVTYWADELPKEITGFLGALMGQPFAAKKIPTALLMGQSCERCGFVELYRVAEDQLRAFLSTQVPPAAKE